MLHFNFSPRLHSIRMHTVRCSGHLGGDVCPGGCLPGGVYTSPPVDRMTDACENISFPQLLLWTVMILCKSSAICVERFRAQFKPQLSEISPDPLQILVHVRSTKPSILCQSTYTAIRALDGNPLIKLSGSFNYYNRAQ